MKKRLSGVILAAEIAIIVVMHILKLSHQEKNQTQHKLDLAAPPANVNQSQTYSFTNFK